MTIIPCNFSNLSNHGCASRTLFCNYRVDVYIEVIDREIQNERKWKQNKNLLSNCSLTFNCLAGKKKKRQEMLSVPTNTTSQHLRIRSQHWKKSLNGKYEEGESCEIHYSPWDLQVCLWHFACVCECLFTCLECRKAEVHVIKCIHVSNPPRSSTVSAVQRMNGCLWLENEYSTRSGM